ncbi:DUF4105 domain-containing protein [Prevotella sp. A2931]|uniref:DUF4105 domain-containing protein n=1 Tax=Prevotella illustrans TaxID=2800387 RepID=A0ABS3M3A7_9BACT|nr:MULTISPECIES: DUF4105 domain-containing protein [Prevotella]MBO1362666.1 DUF4105 domain-containing protein [Prevotella illustrans]PTL25163.1 hypothetical protein C3V39_10695 [Prevotella sp. oral taxon 820]
MKQFKWYFRNAIFLILVSLTSFAKAQDRVLTSQINRFQHDSIAISLITCGPGDQIYSLYGHTAIRYCNRADGEDFVINYGMFSFRQKYFILRFIFGLTDYEMGIIPYSNFITEYLSEGRWVKEQILNISNTDKQNIIEAIRTNYLPENRVYRYNFFYDNCTTRARDILLNHLNESIVFPHNQSINTSFRKEIHQWNKEHLWSRWGNDLLLGFKADVRIDEKARQFLPDQLRQDFDRATLVSKDGKEYKLVKETRWLVSPHEAQIHQKARLDALLINNPLYLIIAIAIVFICISIHEVRHHTYPIIGKICDSLTWGISGLAGFILTAMIFSQHPTVNCNLQIFILNPLNIGLLVPRLRKSRSYSTILLGCYIVGLLGALIQTYASGIILLALILILRVTLYIRVNNLYT